MRLVYAYRLFVTLFSGRQVEPLHAGSIPVFDLDPIIPGPPRCAAFGQLDPDLPAITKTYERKRNHTTQPIPFLSSRRKED